MNASISVTVVFQYYPWYNLSFPFFSVYGSKEYEQGKKPNHTKGNIEPQHILLI